MPFLGEDTTFQLVIDNSLGWHKELLISMKTKYPRLEKISATLDTDSFPDAWWEGLAESDELTCTHCWWLPWILKWKFLERFNSFQMDGFVQCLCQEKWDNACCPCVPIQCQQEGGGVETKRCLKEKMNHASMIGVSCTFFKVIVCGKLYPTEIQVDLVKRKHSIVAHRRARNNLHVRVVCKGGHGEQ